MLAWTRAGAVPQPTTVQVRVQRAYPGRIRAGAPVPTRSMSTEELRANLRYFTVGLDTPRTIPCTALVLSGVGVGSRSDTPGLLDLARGWGVRHAVLHVGVEDLGRLDPVRFAGRVDRLVVPVQPGAGALTAGAHAVRLAREVGIGVVANTVLTARGLPELPVAARALATARPAAVTFTYPFPIAGNTAAEVPGVGAVRAALEGVVPRLEAAGIEVTVKGLPACYLGRLAGRVRPSANRWYVDADHQCEEALLFFPDVVRFARQEACRFCAWSSRCDGFFATYLRREGFPPLHALDEAGRPV